MLFSTLTITFSSLLPLAAASNVWTVNCAPLTVQRSDPILSPGAASAHTHAAVGSTAFGRTMADATVGKATTCDKPTDHSSYWAPQLYSMNAAGTEFRALPFTGMVAYYQNYTCSYNAQNPGYCQGVRDAQAPPAGLRMIAGSSSRRTYDPSNQWEQAILLESGNDGEVYGMPKTIRDRMSGHARFPSCWDGERLDSENHQDHVAYPDPALHGDTQGGMCPKSHPVAMINIGAEFGWDTRDVPSIANLVFANGDTTGFGFHADFVMGWKDRDALTASFANCFDNNDCPWRAFGSPTGKDINPTVQPLDTPAPDEDVGLKNTLTALPGNNPVYKAPARKRSHRLLH